MTHQRVGWLLGLLSVLIFSTNTPVARSVIGDGSMNPVTLVMLRFVLSVWMVLEGELSICLVAAKQPSNTVINARQERLTVDA